MFNIVQKIKVKWTLRKLHKQGVKPTINRTNDKYMGYAVSYTKNFVRVYDGHKVLYFGNPFWNLYRITSITGTKDHVTHSVSKKTQQAA